MFGRTGVITPLAVFKEGKIVDGSRISKATLNNADIIRKKDIRIGDTVIIQKAGDVIPEVVRALEEKRTGKEIVFKMPENCPVCNSKLVKEQVDYKCVNEGCPAIKMQKIIYFASKNCMNKEKKTKAGKSTKFEENILKAIEKSKENSLNRVLVSLGIQGVRSKPK